MKFPVSWLREIVELPSKVTAQEIADALLHQGLEVESVEEFGSDLIGPIVVARVLTVEVLGEYKKPIRWVSVDAGESAPRWVICGAENFESGDLVVVVKPGAVLSGGFEITARDTYGHQSNGMICSAKELGLGEDSSGIIVLPEGSAEVGSDAISLLGLRDFVIEVAVTPDRGYALSLRGISREVATAFKVKFVDPAGAYPLSLKGSIDAQIADPSGADRLVLSSISGWNPAATSPLWMQNRLARCGLRSISLAVDITNYVMLELGQPLHAFDRDQVNGTLKVRRASAGERLTTLDHVDRALVLDDLLIAHDDGPLALAGTMGGLVSEISKKTSVILLEAAHFIPSVIGRMSRRHQLSSEASRRLERGVDSNLATAASARAIDLFCRYGGGGHDASIDIDRRVKIANSIQFNPNHPSNLIGYSYSMAVVKSHLMSIGCSIEKRSASEWIVTSPSWRPDLLTGEDLVEEIARLEGYEKIPSTLLTQSASRGLTSSQRFRRQVGRTLAGADCIEILSYPFFGNAVLDGMNITLEDDRRRLIALVNPIRAEEPFLRTTLLPGLFATLKRNVGRGLRDIAIYELGALFFGTDTAVVLPKLGVERAPSAEELRQLVAAVPEQPYAVAAVLVGAKERQDWQGESVLFAWNDALALALDVVRISGRVAHVKPADTPPWHPGRCAAIYVEDQLIGYAGEIHPMVCSTLDLPPRTCAFEINLTALGDPLVATAPHFSIQPPAIQDVALIVEVNVSASEVIAALAEGGGPKIESVVLFDRYEGPPIPAGSLSLAFTLTFRDPERTLTGEEIALLKEGAIACAGERCGATLRS